MEKKPPVEEPTKPAVPIEDELERAAGLPASGAHWLDLDRPDLERRAAEEIRLLRAIREEQLTTILELTAGAEEADKLRKENKRLKEERDRYARNWQNALELAIELMERPPIEDLP
jgi:hypothetical protein